MDGTLNIPVPEAASLEEKPINGLAAAQTIEVPTSDMVANSDVAGVARINFNSKMTMPKTINRFPDSGIKFYQTPYDHDLFIWLDYGKLDATTPLSLLGSRISTVLKWVQEYTFLLGRFPSVIESEFNTNSITPYPDCGFNLKEAFLKLNWPNAQRYDSVLKTISDVDDKSDKIAYVLKSCILTKDERELVERANEISYRRVAKYDSYQEFYRHLSDMVMTIAPQKIQDERFVKTYLPPPMRALSAFIMKNMSVAPVMWDMWMHIVRSYVVINLTPSDATFTDMLQVMNVSSTTHQASNNYPARLKATAGTEFMQAWFTAKFASMFSKIYIGISFDDVSMSQLMQCICAKLMLARHEVHPDSVIDVDNYLAKWFIPAQPGFIASRYEFNQERAEQRSVNYLSINIANAVLGPLTNIFRNFFQTEESGAGWANAGANQVVPVPASAVRLLNGRQMWFREPFGVKQKTRSSVPKQFTNLEELVKAWGNNTLQVLGPYRDIGRSIQRLVSWIMTKRYMFSELYWYSRRVVARFSYNALCFPDDMKRMEYQLSSYPLMPDSIFSAISYININGSTPLSMPLELIESAWAIHDDFNDLNDRFTYIRNAVHDSIYKDHYSRKDIFKMAVAASSDRTGFLSYLTTKMIDEDEIKSIQMPGDKFMTADFKDRVAMVENFMKNHIRGFGIYENFIYSPSPSYAANSHIKRYLKPQNPASMVTYPQLQDMLSIEAYGPMLREARLNNTAIEFRLAINFTVNYVDVWKTRPGPLRLPTSGNVLSTSELSIDLTTNDVIINDNLSDIADYGVFPWVVSELPFIGYDVSYFTSMISTIRTPKRDIELAPKPTFFMAYNT